MAEITIKGIKGNPLNVQVIMTEVFHGVQDGETINEVVDFIPDLSKPVRAFYDCVTARRQYCPLVAVEDNIAYVSESGTMKAGVYTLTIICTGTNGKTRRYKSEPCIEIYDETDAADITVQDPYILNGVFYTSMVQSDWDEVNPASPAYILNKPDLTEYATKEDIETIEGEIPVIPEWAQQPQKPSYTAGEVGAVPTSRTVNGKALSEDITLNAQDVGAQTPIADLAQIREGAAKGATAYQKPSTGIAKSDLTNGIQQSLDRADTALQAAALTPLQNQIDTINNKIPTDATSTNELADKNYVERLVNEKQDTINDLDAIRSGAAKGATAYQLPSNGMPKTDLAVGVQQSLDKANTAYQKPSSGIPKTDLAQEIQQRLDIPIDDEPTAGSNNLVKSGGVENKISQLSQKLDGNYSSDVWEMGSILTPDGGHIQDTGNSQRLRQHETVCNTDGEYIFTCKQGYEFLLFVVGKITTVEWATFRKINLVKDDIFRVALRQVPAVDYSTYTQEQIDAVGKSSGLLISGPGAITSLQKTDNALEDLLKTSHESTAVDLSPFLSDWRNGYCIDTIDNFIVDTATKTCLIPVSSGMVITISGKSQSSNYRVFDIDGNEIKRSNSAYYSSVKNGSFEMPNNAKYIQINCVLGIERESLIRITCQSETIESPFFAPSFFSPLTSLSPGYVYGYPSNPGKSMDPAGTLMRTYYIPLKGANYVYFLGCKPKITNSDVGYAFYDKNKVCVDAGIFPYDEEQASYSSQDMVRKVPPTAEYFATSIYNEYSDQFYIRLAYDKILSIPSIKEQNYSKRATSLRYSPCRDFGAQPAAIGNTESFCDVINGTYSELIASVYDPITAEYPNYVTKHNIGKDASGTIDMFAYVFEPEGYQQTVILTAGVHAVEVSAIASLARIMQLIASSENTDDDLYFLRRHIRFVVIPVVNVWGFSQIPHINTNSDGANMQGWNANPLIAELDNIKTFLSDYVGGASFLMDMHTTTSANYPDFYGVINQDAENSHTILRVASWLREHYHGRERTLTGWDGYVPIGVRKIDQHSLGEYFNNIENVFASTMELTDYIWDGTKIGTQATASIITMGVTMFLNYIIQQCNDFYRNQWWVGEYGITKG